MDLKQIVFEDFSTGNPCGAVIFLHGAGDNGLKAKECMEELLEGPPEGKMRIPPVKMFFPSAPSMYVKLRDKVTTSWFDGERIGSNLHEIDCNYEDCDRAAASIVNLIEQIEASGIPRSKIVLAGFSQGAMVAQYVAFTKVREIAGVIAIASVFPFVKAKMLEGRHPVLYQMYGAKDPIIPLKGVRLAESFLKSRGVTVRLNILPSSAHTMDEYFLKMFFEILSHLLPA